jgi:antitoxin component YwqK of YwqJK toxin-antitoxin module
MLQKKTYSNGQKVYELIGNKLTYFFKTGKVKAAGHFENDKMEGEWKFYRETGQLWVVGNFSNGKKNGSWIRYDKNDHLEYEETFRDDKVIKKK